MFNSKKAQICKEKRRRNIVTTLQDFRTAYDGQQREFGLLYTNSHLLEEKDFRDEWNRQPFSLENERTGEVLDFKRVKIDGPLSTFDANKTDSKLVLLLHRHPKIGPLQSIERLFTAVHNKNEKVVKFYNSRPDSAHRCHYHSAHRCQLYHDFIVEYTIRSILHSAQEKIGVHKISGRPKKKSASKKSQL